MRAIPCAVVFVVVSAFAAGCATMQPDPADIGRTWSKAMVALPSSMPAYPLVVIDPEKVTPRERLPTVLHMHACSGISASESGWAGFLTRAGYAVVMPDSFARKRRISDCDPATSSAGRVNNAYHLRLEEIAYALPRLRALAWVDSRNIFLTGVSEGGAAVALWSGGEFNARVIMAWWCRHPDATLDGIRAPFATPLLAINYERDPWFRGSSSSCGARFKAYADAREMIVPGPGHEAQGREAREAVLDFLRRHTIK